MAALPVPRAYGRRGARGRPSRRDPLAQYCARNPVALEQHTYDRTAKAVTSRSDKSEGPTAGTETVDPRAFLVLLLVHPPHQGYVTTRDYGWYARRWTGVLQQTLEVDPLAFRPATALCGSWRALRKRP